MRTLLFLFVMFMSFSALAWQNNLKAKIEKIDSAFNGDIGIVVKNLKDGSTLEYNADKKWYLSSTVKVFVAISLLEQVEEGKLSLDKKVTLKQEDFVDGAGSVIWNKPGTQFTVEALLKAMLRDSDNTATDMLIDLIGVDELNRDVQKWMPDTGKITDLLEVRYLAYSELHPKARTLSNMDFILLKNVPLEKRHISFAEKLKLSPENLKAGNLEEAYEKYYIQNFNTTTLQSYVGLLEKLEKGSLLSKAHTELVLKHMEKMKTGDHRVKAALTPELKFLQKTGTQIHRACNVGLIRKSDRPTSEVALAICISKPSESINSDEVFQKIGEELVNSELI